MSSFSSLHRAFTGVTAARIGLDLAGQNIANANTVGYTRQRVNQSGVSGGSGASMFSRPDRVGGGVTVNTIERLSNSFFDTKLRQASSGASFSARISYEFDKLQANLREPSDTGLSSNLSDFWSSWQDLGNSADSLAAGQVVIEKARSLASSISAGYADVAKQWDVARTSALADVSGVNELAKGIAELNGQIEALTNSGGSPNELLDMRDTLINELSGLVDVDVQAGRANTVDIRLNGNLLVSGSDAQRLKIEGASTIEEAGSRPLTISWDRTPATPASITGGDLGALMSALSGTKPDGTGGMLAEAAHNYNRLAENLATKVNAVHQSGVQTDGVTPGGPVFDLGAGPSAATITVVLNSPKDLAPGAPGGGGFDGSIADKIFQLGLDPAGPSALWREATVAVGIKAAEANQRTEVGRASLESAAAIQQAGAGVDLDEETLNLAMYQRSYQAASRAMTAVDEALETIIMRTGRVGL